MSVPRPRKATSNAPAPPPFAMAPPAPTPPAAPESAGTALGQVTAEEAVRDGGGRVNAIVEAAAEPAAARARISGAAAAAAAANRLVADERHVGEGRVSKDFRGEAAARGRSRRGRRRSYRRWPGCR